MARNRQKAKARKRRAEQHGHVVPQPRTQAESGAERSAELDAGAPPEEVGRTDVTVANEADAVESTRGLVRRKPKAVPATAQKADSAPAKRPREKGRIISFFKSCVAELKRVQWPNREQVTALSGVVLGFVVIAGGYLGLLDAIFSKLIDKLLAL